VSDGIRTVLRGVGQALITVGLVLLLFCVYELYVTGIYTSREQTRLGDQLARQWQAPPPATTAGLETPPLGGAFARLWIPRFGSSWSEVVVEGVGVEDLKKGPGHYPGTALPGRLGNTVLSGHRTTYQAPFNRADALRPGDAVVLETRTQWVTYRVTGTQVVAPTAIGVTYPVPGKAGAKPTRSVLTMTTCHPKYSAKQRMVVSGLLDQTLDKGPGVRPPALPAAG